MADILIATNDIRPDLHLGGHMRVALPPAGGPVRHRAHVRKHRVSHIRRVHHRRRRM